MSKENAGRPRMTPDDFKFQLLQHAHALYHSALSRSASFELDPKTTMWLITSYAEQEFMKSKDIMNGFYRFNDAINKRTLFNLPVRITINDLDGTPPIQLVMEPMVLPYRHKGGGL